MDVTEKLPGLLIDPKTVCLNCFYRHKNGRLLNNASINWCPECGICDRIPSKEVYQKTSKIFYLGEKCIGYNGMSGYPELRHLPSQVLGEDAELMSMVDFFYDQRVKSISDRKKREDEIDKIKEDENGRHNTDR